MRIAGAIVAVAIAIVVVCAPSAEARVAATETDIHRLLNIEKKNLTNRRELEEHWLHHLKQQVDRSYGKKKSGAGGDDDIGGITEWYDVCDQVQGALGYPCQHHAVHTEDGFLLDVIHIPAKAPNSPAVILQHGLVDSAVTWVANANPYQNLGCILHDAGYDVWMPNSRGNHYSMNNTNYAPYTSRQRDTAYWQAIDMDEMALYDLPANIEYVKNYTGKPTVSYVGHSQGTWQAFSAFSTSRRDLASSVNIFVALAPVCWVGHTTSLLLKLIADLDAAKLIAIFTNEFLVNDWLIHELVKVCPDLGNVCMDLFNLVMGNGSPSNTNTSQLPTITLYTPGGTSINNMIHWQQEVVKDDYKFHDYGSEENRQKYNGSSSPPSYELGNMVGPPTAMFSGDRDALADPADVERILSAVPPTTIVNATYLNGYAHMDFVWGLDAHTRLYPKVKALIEKYNPV